MPRILLPDPNSWLIDGIFNFFKLIKNEFNLSLYEALHEFVEYFAYECQYLGHTNTHNLELYMQIDYESDKRFATIEKIFFISQPVKFIKTWNYLQDLSLIKDKIILKKIHDFSPTNFEGNMPGLQFFISFNNMELHPAKDALIKYSFQRESIKKLIVIENEAKNYKDKALNIAIITYDLNFLEKSKFFEVKRYQFFKHLLPPNLLVEIPITVDVNIKDVPDALRSEQMFVSFKQ